MKSFKTYVILFLMLFLLINISVQADKTSDLDYETELAKFPSDYQELLKELHKDHPNWIFTALQTGLNWDDVIAGESKEDRSLLRKQYSALLLSKDSADYNASTGTYTIYDGTSSVKANNAAIAYYVDPRNYLTENSIFAMQLLSYDSSSHTLNAVESILSGTELADQVIEYIDTKGNSVTMEMTYGEAILAAGAKYDVNPLMLAARIRQETGGKLSYDSICGTYTYNGTSYQGYYNFFNIKANASSTGSATANGLTYAKGSGEYGRPWDTPLKAILGGAQYLAKGYINVGQNTNYLQKFDVVNKPYYTHQYMQTLYAVMSEASSTYNAYKNYGMLDETIIFSIPVYENMPAQTGTLTIDKEVSTGTVTASSSLSMRKGPSTAYSVVTTLPAGAKVTVTGGVFTDKTQSVTNKLNSPYWLKVSYNGKSGYVSASYIKMDPAYTITAGKNLTLTLSKSLSGEKVYYQTEDPAIATVNVKGQVTGVKKGTCTIYVYSSSGQIIDAAGIQVIDDTNTPDVPETPETPTTPDIPETPTTPSITYTKYKTTTSVNYRDGAGTSYSKKGTLKEGTVIEVEDGYSKSANGYTWYRFKHNSGTYYIASNYLKKVTTTTETPETPTTPSVTYTKYKTTTSVNYRSGAGTSYSKKGTLKEGTVIQVENGYSKKANGYTWYRFKYNSGTYYIASNYLKKVTTTTETPSTPSVTYTKYKTTTSVNYRSGAGTSYSKVGTLKEGTVIQVENGYSKKANGYTWYRFKYNSKTYYVASEYLKKAQ